MSENNLEKVTIRIPRDDHEWLLATYPRGGYNKIIRLLVANHRRKVDERTQKLLDEKDTEDADDNRRPVFDGPVPADGRKDQGDD